MNINGESMKARLAALMPSVVLCTTGLSTPEREEVCEKARTMGALVDNDLSQITTHLVCKRARGSKYDASWRSPLLERLYRVTPEYVRDCHAHMARLDEAKYSVPALSGLRVALSGFEGISRDLLRDTIVRGGGAYMPTLDAHTTDVLVARRPVGAKYCAATSWKIPCVSRKWLDDSLVHGHRLNECDYMLQLDDPIGQKRKQCGLQHVLPEGKTDCVNHAFLRAPASDVFDGVIVFLVGVNVLSSCTPGIDALLSRGQGTRFKILSNAVTHVVVPSGFILTDHQREFWSQHTHVHVVRASWVATSAARGEKQPEFHFLPPRPE
eukprot:CAMPEP_0119295912 /NCGR_PEP_ID=MMETSP1329-20130426/50303_1 /TAXON_ID=114041 /ORGANISM="Genus nov. species nov., Strain RCC1024" /LENGTH=323 /DNA_ID=CAMNT_0007296835 /DNA_START=699 /DNA_END=1670 /DNA_ORIENTATION=-